MSILFIDWNLTLPLDRKKVFKKNKRTKFIEFSYSRLEDCSSSLILVLLSLNVVPGSGFESPDFLLWSVDMDVRTCHLWSDEKHAMGLESVRKDRRRLRLPSFVSVRKGRRRPCLLCFSLHHAYAESALLLSLVGQWVCPEFVPGAVRCFPMRSRKNRSWVEGKL